MKENPQDFRASGGYEVKSMYAQITFPIERDLLKRIHAVLPHGTRRHIFARIVEDMVEILESLKGDPGLKVVVLDAILNGDLSLKTLLEHKQKTEKKDGSE